MKKVLFRADANSKIGVGHVMRCVALAQYLASQNVLVRFLTVTDSERLSQYLSSQKFETRVINSTPKNDENVQIILKELRQGFDWVILDSYDFGENHHRKISEANIRLLVLEDNPPYSQCADLVLNHALQDNEESSDSRFLFGTHYALIRQELIQAEKRGEKGQQNIIITLGGAAFPDLYKKIIRSIGLITEFKLKIKLLHGFSIDSEVVPIDFADHQIEYCEPTPDVGSIFNWADLSISAAGGTSWELCFFGVVGIVGLVADNQVQIARNLDRKGIFKSVGSYQDCSEQKLADELKRLLSNPALVKSMRSKARELVDGKGPERIFQAMQNRERLKMSVQRP